MADQDQKTFPVQDKNKQTHDDKKTFAVATVNVKIRIDFQCPDCNCINDHSDNCEYADHNPSAGKTYLFFEKSALVQITQHELKCNFANKKICNKFYEEMMNCAERKYYMLDLMSDFRKDCNVSIINNKKKYVINEDSDMVKFIHIRSLDDENVPEFIFLNSENAENEESDVEENNN